MENILINVDSRFRNKNIYKDSGKFSLKLNDKIKNVAYINITSIEIPNLFFTFSENLGNNKFSINVMNTNYNFVLPDGFYNSDQFLNKIQEFFNNNISGVTITIELDENTGKVKIFSDKLAIITFYDDEINNNYETNRKLGFHMGFVKNKYIMKQIKPTEFILESESQLNIIGEKYCLLKVNDYGTIINFNKNDNSTLESIDRYLAKIIIEVDKAEPNFDNKNFISKKHIFRKPEDINRLDIELHNPYGEIIDMEKMNFSFTIELGIVYDNKLYNKLLFDTI